MSQLRVLSDGVWIGTLDVTEGRWSFAYAPEWTLHPLAPGFPLTVREFQDAGEHRPVEWFFENLLPEGRLRELIAFRDRIDPRDSWAFLVRHGQDTAGALSLVPANPDGDVPGEVLVPLAVEALQAKIEESRKRNLPLMASWDEIRMSLAGAQEKLGLRIEPDGAMFLPEGTAASTHIVKPENASADFPYCPANEFFCMRLADELKVPVPRVGLRHLPEPLYDIERFDRTRTKPMKGEEGSSIKRLHQIDLCQALGVSPTRKYESEAYRTSRRRREFKRTGAFLFRSPIPIRAPVRGPLRRLREPCTGQVASPVCRHRSRNTPPVRRGRLPISPQSRTAARASRSRSG